MTGSASRLVSLVLFVWCATVAAQGTGVPEPSGPSIQVDTLAGAEIIHPAVAWRCLADVTLVVWQSSLSVGHDDDGTSIQGQFFLGREKLRPQFQVNTFKSGDQTVPVVEVDDGGNFVVAWASDDDTLRRRIFERISLQPGPELVIAQPVAESIDLEPGGGFSASWQDGDFLRGQRFGLSGSPNSAELEVDWWETPGWVDPRIRRQQIRSRDAGQLLAWSSSAIAPSGGDVRSFVTAERFSPSGTSLGRVPVAGGYYAFSSEGDWVGRSLALLVPSGGFVVAYFRDYLDELEIDPYYYIKLRRFDGGGNSVFHETVWFSVNPDYHPLSLRGLAVEADDDLMVMWSDEVSRELAARRYPSGLPPADDGFLVSDRATEFSPYTSNAQAAIAFSDPTSRFVAVWWNEDCDLPASNECLFIRWFRSYPGVHDDDFETGDTSRWCTASSGTVDAGCAGSSWYDHRRWQGR